jgi:GT2 family glycosyltransferase
MYYFSVIIPTFNRRDTLLKNLEALTAQTFPASDFEVLVCDDGSTDDTSGAVDAVKSLGAPFALRYLRQANSGPAAARNMGIREAAGRYLLILNDDAIAAPDLLERHRAALHRHSGEPIAVLGSFQFPPEHTASPFGRILEDTGLLFEFYRLQAGRHYDFRVFYTCNLSVPRRAVLDAGMFDEVFRGPSSEDIDLGYRLFQRGLTVLYEPSCRSVHLHKIDPRAFCAVRQMRGREVILKFALHPELSWYRGVTRSTIAAWRAADAALSDAVGEIVDRISELNILSSSSSAITSGQVSYAAMRMLPAVRFIGKFYARRGALSSPYLDKFIDAVKSSKPLGVAHDEARPEGVRLESGRDDDAGTLPVEFQDSFDRLDLLLREAAGRELEIINGVAAEDIRQRRVYIWGAGGGGRQTLDALRLIGIGVEGFIDRDERKAMGRLAGLPVRPVDFLRVEGEIKTGDNETGKPFVFIGSMYGDEIAEALKGMGYGEGRDYCPGAVIY